MAFLSQKSVPGLDSALDGIGGDGERQHERERRIVESESPIALIPARGALVLGVDQQRDAADIIGDPNATMRGAQQESAAEAAPLYRTIHSKATEPGSIRRVGR